jgi:thiamine-phosphate pyrophosphorylase
MSRMRALTLPRLYCIIDAAAVADPPDFGRRLIAGGATLIQYRNKAGSSREVLSQARELHRIALAHEGVTLIMNDRADLCLAAAFEGVHVGQDDLSPDSVRRIVGAERWVGVSTHNVKQIREADTTSADYIAIGPVFETSSKRNPDPVIGLDGVRGARLATKKPLVAIGGITRDNCRDVITAGADCVAVISDVVADPEHAVRAFLDALGT